VNTVIAFGLPEEGKEGFNILSSRTNICFYGRALQLMFACYNKADEPKTGP
jgi:hypothetical protein